MRYRIDFVGDQKSLAVNSRSDLLKWLKQLHPIMIPEWRYYKMLETYDNTMKELEKLKKAFEELTDSSKAE